MLYLSQLLHKTVYVGGKPYGKIIDLAIFENRPVPPVSKIEIKHKKERLTVSPQALKIKGNRLELSSQAQHIPLLPYDHKDFYLVEDMLDKQVIDIDGKRLVRVNDIVIEEKNNELKVVGIDIGIGGIVRRLNLPFWQDMVTIIPWSTIEAFDYQTGNVKIKLKQSSLNTLHPADIADILEEVGTKERLGIVEALDSKKAARAIEEADEETQISILESLKPNFVKDIIAKMHIAEVADVINDLNPLKAKEVQNALSAERMKNLKNLLSYSDDVAGGLMHLSFYHADGEKTVKEVLSELTSFANVPETIIVTNGEEKINGVIASKDLLIVEKLAKLADIVSEKKFVYAQTPLDELIQLFAQYNLRVLPVINKDKKPIGIVIIDDILKLIEKERQKDENL